MDPFASFLNFPLSSISPDRAFGHSFDAPPTPTSSNPAKLLNCRKLFQRASEPPSVPLRVPSTVFALPVGLILGLTLYRGAALTRVCVVRIDIVHMDHQATSGHRLRAR